MQTPGERPNLLHLWIPTPVPGFASDLIDPGAAVVSVAEREVGANGMLVVYFEANQYGLEEGRTFIGRVRMAGRRAVERHPTIRRVLVPADSLIQVGTYDWDTGELMVFEHRRLALFEYLGAVPVR